MIAVVRRPAPVPPIRTRSAEPKKPSSPSKQQTLQPAGQRTGTGSSSVLPYLSLPR